MLDWSLADGIARITLRRPEARNAIFVAGWSLLAEAVRAAGAEARVVLLSGEGSTFSAGADLRELAMLATDEAARAPFRLAMRGGIEAVTASPVPVIAAIGGGCFGAGVALALAADIRVAAPAARFAIPPARIGIAYPQADINRLVATVGPGRARRLLLSAETIDAAEALRIGLVDALVEDGGEALATAIAANDADSVALLRRQVAGLDPAEADRAFDDRFGSATFAGVAAGIRERS